MKETKIQMNFFSFRDNDLPVAFDIVWVIPRKIGGLELAIFFSQLTVTLREYNFG